MTERRHVSIRDVDDFGSDDLWYSIHPGPVRLDVRRIADDELYVEYWSLGTSVANEWVAPSSFVAMLLTPGGAISAGRASPMGMEDVIAADRGSFGFSYAEPPYRGLEIGLRAGGSITGDPEPSVRRFVVDPEASAELRAQALCAVRTWPTMAASDRVRRMARVSRALERMVTTWSIPSESGTVERARDVVAEFVDVARRDPEASITDIVSLLPGSRATVYRAFRDAMGITPQRWLTVRRLHLLRRALRMPDQRTSIAALERRFGLTHASNTARRYRQLFGETPSQTRSRTRRSSGDSGQHARHQR